MKREEAEQLACRILAEVERVMDEEGVTVSGGDSDSGIKSSVAFASREDKALEETIIGILLGAGEVEPTLRVESLDGHDR